MTVNIPVAAIPLFFQRVKKGNTNSKRYLHSCVHCTIIHDSQEMEATYVAMDMWMDREDMVYTMVY